MPIVHLNSIAIDPRNPYRFAVAGSDVYARVYDIRMCRRDGKPCGKPADCFVPLHLIGDNHFEITGLAFSDQSELLASYNLDVIYLFLKDQGLGPNPYSIYSNSTMTNGHTMQTYKGHINCKTIKGVNFFGPNCEYVTSGSDCGRLFIWRKKGGELLRVMKGDKHVVNCIESHPYTTMLASCGIKKSIKIWLPNAVEQAAPIDFYE
ncbi:DDB1- and CUL4-associated factor 8-like, partial [Phalaenopsis equestris]|uniref:DDB1- and CUL4-associated factor 8-like n=1 Tax=Phalaenopsis equestris TaxID=78828 RepID=UPI0009E328BB